MQLSNLLELEGRTRFAESIVRTYRYCSATDQQQNLPKIYFAPFSFAIRCRRSSLICAILAALSSRVSSPAPFVTTGAETFLVESISSNVSHESSATGAAGFDGGLLIVGCGFFCGEAGREGVVVVLSEGE